MTADRFDLHVRAAADRVAADGTGPCPDPERLIALYSGRLTDAESEALGEHLTRCSRCREEGRHARLYLAAMRGERAPTAFPDRRSERRPALRWAAAAVLLLAGGLGFYLGWTRHSDVAVEIAKAPFEPAALDPGTVLYRDAEGIDPEVEQSLGAAMEPYLRDDFPAAEVALAGHLARHPTDQRARLYRAISLLMLRRDAEALPLLEEVERMAAPGLVGEARWYRALTLLRMGQRQPARAELELIAHGEGPHRGAALALLDRLGGAGSP